jgi:hypothetical protein
MSHTDSHLIRRRSASFTSADSPKSPASPFARNSSSNRQRPLPPTSLHLQPRTPLEIFSVLSRHLLNSASSFGCSEFPSCIHWCDQLEESHSYEMLHFDVDSKHVDFLGEAHEVAIDEGEDLVRLGSLGRHSTRDFSAFDRLDTHCGSDLLVRSASAPSTVGAHASETKLKSLIRALKCSSLKDCNPNRTIHVILRGMELKQPAWEQLSECLYNHDISVLDIAPKVKFDSDSKSYVHCSNGKI